MTIKKILVLCAASAVILSMAACNKAETATSSSGKVKLTALYTKHPLTKDFNEMKWLKEIADEVGVEVEWQQISADWDQKRAPMLASGDVPDLFFGGAVGDVDYAVYQGLFVDMAPLIEQYAPNIKRMFQEKPETLVLSKQPDGAIYATPKYQRFWPKTNGTMFINKQWLDNLNLAVPTTWDELYNVLVAFRDGDPNGNGDTRDEIPMDFIGFDCYSPLMLIGATGIQITNWGYDGYFAEDGKVKNYYMDTRYRDLVAFMHKLYAANLINPEALTQDYSTFQSISRGQGNTAKIGFTWGWESGDRFGTVVADQYISIPPLKLSANSSIDPRWMYDFYGLNMDGNRVSMTTRCKNQEAAMRFIDAFYNPEKSLQVLFGGITDGNIAKNADGSYTILPPQDSSIDPGTWKWTTAFADGGPIYLSDSMQVTLGSDMQQVTGEKSVYDHAFTLIDPKKDVLPLSFLKLSSEDNATRDINRVAFRNIADAKWAQWLTVGGIEAEWDQYVRDLINSGIEDNNRIIQKYFDVYLQGLR
ncbi:ABC transporter substrate-binding protein [Spirochaetia bacterium]|nr:ABC transporter substrate-binding protein [Spirochaetia bacterium]